MKDNLEQIRSEIILDKNNARFTKTGWLPLYVASPKAKIAIISQAPGRKAQVTNTAWNDISGDRLRKWLGVSKKEFYNPDNFAIIPMDFYYPGKGKSGDNPPRPGFAKKWHGRILAELPNVKLIILVGWYAQKYYLSSTAKADLTSTVASYKDYLPKFLPIVHPSPLNYGWLKKNSWFEGKLIKDLQPIVTKIIKQNDWS